MEHKRKIYLYVSVLLLLLFILLQACDPTPEPSRTPSITSFATVIPSSTLTSTPCPYVTPIPTPTLTRTKLIYVLIDRSGSFGAFTQSAVNVLIKGLMMSIEPGDNLFLVWLGANEDPKNYLLYDGTIPTV